MTKKKKSKKKKKTAHGINKNLPGFDINIDPFGEIQSTYNIDDVNSFLNQNLEDKKLKKESETDRDEDTETDDTESKGNS